MYNFCLCFSESSTTASFSELASGLTNLLGHTDDSDDSFSEDDKHLAIAGPDESITIINYNEIINYDNYEMDSLIVHAHKSKVLCVLYTALGN